MLCWQKESEESEEEERTQEKQYIAGKRLCNKSTKSVQYGGTKFGY